MSYTCYNCFQEKPNNDACPFCGYVPENEEEKYPNALQPGSILNGRYIIGHVLGQGGFGITYIAKDYQTGERVAIKEYLPSEFAGRNGNSVQAFSKDQKENFEYGKEQFLSEAKTLAAFIGDEHIVRIYSFFEENNTAYFTMEYVDGLALDKYMAQQGGRLTVAEANRLLLPLMESLNKVHTKGIVHRDIAPDNIIVTKDGSVKLIDFGAARYSTGEKSRSLDVIMKHGFAPPEQYMRRGRQGPFTDVYALAATYYYAITGKLLPDSVERTFEDTIMLPHSLGVRISRKQEDALLKALEVNAANRYQNMGEFHHEMAQASGVKEEAVSSKEKAGKEQKQAKAVGQSKTKKHTILAGVITIVCLTLVVAVAKNILPNLQKKQSSETDVIDVDTSEPAIENIDYAQQTNESVEQQGAKVSIGDYVLFGSYEQDHDLTNGKEPIEWLVLDIRDSKALIISRYALDFRQYSKIRSGKWETSSLRTWLNDTFLNESFSSEEHRAIPTVTVTADKNSAYSTNPGNETKDKVFLLSITESENYFLSDEARKCTPTDYAISQYLGTYGIGNKNQVDGKATCSWWLRTPGKSSVDIASVYVDGSINVGGGGTEYIGLFAVRPALWVDLEAFEGKVSSFTELVSTDESGDSSTETDVKNQEKVLAGDYVIFGNYEQDNDLSNGKEPIEWVVLDVQDNRALLLSRYALDCKPYNNKYGQVTWELCTLRSWLNNDFLQEAFDLEIQESILTVTVSTDENPKYSVYLGKETRDKLFLLSILEAEAYFDNNKERTCLVTAYAIAQGDQSVGGWWLRTPGDDSIHTAAVRADGVINYVGYSININWCTVRPAFWIDLESLPPECVV